MTKLTVLILDDEPEILKSLTRVLRSTYEVETFSSGQQALDAMAQKLFPIIISDMRMPEMDGAEFLHKAHQINPICQKILLTGHADLGEASRAINQGHIDFYLSKPWDNEELLNTLASSAERFSAEYKRRTIYRQIKHKNQQLSESATELKFDLKEQVDALHHAEHKSEVMSGRLKQTLHHTIELLNDCIRLHCLDDLSHGDRVSSQVIRLGRELKLPPNELVHASIAAKLYQLGHLQLPQDVLSKPRVQLKFDERVSLVESILVTCDMLMPYPELAPTIEIIRNLYIKQKENVIASENHNQPCSLATEILHICSQFDLVITGKISGHTMDKKRASEYFSAKLKHHYHQQAFDTFMMMRARLASAPKSPTEYAVTADELMVGMELARDLPLEAAKSNYLNQGHVLTAENIERLLTIGENREERVIICVYPVP